MITEADTPDRVQAMHESSLQYEDGFSTLGVMPTPLMSAPEMLDPRGYIPDQLLLDAIDASVLLGQPLLLSGEPGSGKSEVARLIGFHSGFHVTNAHGDQEYCLRFDVKSNTEARDLFYYFDNIARFHAAQNSGDIDPINFVTLNALGLAIVNASTLPDGHKLRHYCSHLPKNGGRLRSVVLIDEIDKAPRDVPNDILIEIEKMLFHIPEMNISVSADKSLRPIVVFTSNRERALPDAFLRRCIFHPMNFPDHERLLQIVCSRVPRFPRETQVLSEIIDLFINLRKTGLARPPGLAELLSFVQILGASSMIKKTASLKDTDWWCGRARNCMLKAGDDHGLMSDDNLKSLVRGE